jgi:cytochrome c-type biogenesis protein CcmH/NrfF
MNSNDYPTEKCPNFQVSSIEKDRERPEGNKKAKEIRNVFERELKIKEELFAAAQKKTPFWNIKAILRCFQCQERIL